MFGFLKKKTSDNEIIYAPMAGKAIESSEIPDPTFGEEMLGKGMAIVPSEGKLYAPFDGTVSVVFKTCHAITMTSDAGTEMLLHVGLDTVSLKGGPFDVKVAEGSTVKKGDLLMEFDISAIKEAGLSIISPMVICNSDDFNDVIRIPSGDVVPGDKLMEIVR